MQSAARVGAMVASYAAIEAKMNADGVQHLFSKYLLTPQTVQLKPDDEKGKAMRAPTHNVIGRVPFAVALALIAHGYANPVKSDAQKIAGKVSRKNAVRYLQPHHCLHLNICDFSSLKFYDEAIWFAHC